METVTGIGFKNPERRWWVASSNALALVVQLAAVLEAWREAFSLNPGCSAPVLRRHFIFLLFLFLVCLSFFKL